MKLITSFTDATRCITESVGGEKKYYIEGIFMQAETPNRNNRIYPKDVLAEAVDKYVKEQVSTNRAVGEISHPEGPSINYDRVSHRITSLKWKGNDVIGKALVLDTPMGQIAKGLLAGGVQLGVSSRGMGDVDEGRNGVATVREGYLINAVDIVQDPSAPTAFVNGILEGVEYYFDSRKNSFVAEESDKLRSRLRKMSRTQIVESQVAEFSAFMQTISRK